MKKTEDDEMQILTDKRKGTQEEIMDIIKMATESKKKKKSKSKEKKSKIKEEKENKDEEKHEKKNNLVNNSLFDIVGRYNLIKMLGSGSFGEIHLAFDTQTTQLCAIKFELALQKNPQLKHESNILEQLNRIDSKDNNQNLIPEGIPKLFNFERIENKCNFMVMEFLGPSLADLFQFKGKRFSKTTVLLLGIQMLQRIEFMHEKGFIHRDIKPENFVIGLAEKSATVFIIDFGLSKRYKDKNTGQHIPYRENRHLVGTARYASINAHLGIEQSRRDDIESIGYVLVYFLLGRLPWQSKNEKNKQPGKIMEKKLQTPPEVLCKKLPMEFAYYFHYCKNLKFEDRPDYSTLKSLFFDLLMQDYSINTEFVFDWFLEPEEEKEKEDRERNKANKPSYNININNPETNETNLIDLTPMDGTVKKPQFDTKPVKKEFANTKTAEFNSPVKNIENKNGTINSIGGIKRRTQSFSESGSSDSSDDDGTLRKKADDEEIKKTFSSDDKKDDSRFNIIKSSSEESKKNENHNNNFNIDDEIQFKNSRQDPLDIDSRKKLEKQYEGDVILNIKKK